MSAIGLVFLLYLFGTLASAQAGRMVGHYGRDKALVGAAMAIVGMPVIAAGQLWLMLRASPCSPTASSPCLGGIRVGRRRGSASG